MSESKLTAEKVQAIIKDCLFKPDEITDGKPPSNAVIVEGIVRNFGLHKERLESHRAEVIELLRELPGEFFTGEGGGGWTFLNMCNDKHGVQWGEHQNMEELCVLAIGLGIGKFQLPREMWNVLPGGMPYIAFTVYE